MKSSFLAATALATVLSASVVFGATAKSPKPPTPAEATAFVAKAEADLAREAEYQAHAAWVQATYIMDDTDWLVAKANAESTDMSVRYAKEAVRFDHVTVDPATRRK